MLRKLVSYQYENFGILKTNQLNISPYTLFVYETGFHVSLDSLKLTMYWRITQKSSCYFHHLSSAETKHVLCDLKPRTSYMTYRHSPNRTTSPALLIIPLYILQHSHDSMKKTGGVYQVYICKNQGSKAIFKNPNN